MLQYSPAQIVIALRVALKLNQLALATRLGVTRVSVGRWERGVSIPSRLAWRAMRDLARLEPSTRGLLSEIDRACVL